MSALIAIGFAIVGIFFIIFGRPFVEVAACFIICGLFSICNEIWCLRQDLEDEE